MSSVGNLFVTTCVAAAMTLAFGGCMKPNENGAEAQRYQRIKPNRPQPRGKRLYNFPESQSFLQIVSNSGRYGEYVGCFNCSMESFESIFNPESFFYRRLAASNSKFGGLFGKQSMCNWAAENPPRLEIWNAPYSLANIRASVSETHNGSICNTFSESYWETGCAALKKLCGN